MLGVGVLMMAPALVSITLFPDMLLRTWLVEQRSEAGISLEIEHEGLSGRGFGILSVGAAGLLLAGFAALTRHAGRTAPSDARRALRVHAPETDDDGRVEVTGIARLATAELQSALGASPCLAFGLRGEVDGAEVDDAEGGDFDVVLPGGEAERPLTVRVTSRAARG